MEPLMNIIVVILMAAGLILFFGGVVGLILLPDFYTRLQCRREIGFSGYPVDNVGLSPVQFWNISPWPGF